MIPNDHMPSNESRQPPKWERGELRAPSPEQMQELQKLLQPASSNKGFVLAIVVTLFVILGGAAAFACYHTIQAIHFSEITAQANMGSQTSGDLTGEADSHPLSPQEELKDIKNSFERDERFVSWFKTSKRDFESLVDIMQENPQLRGISTYGTINGEEKLTLNVAHPLGVNNFEVENLGKILQKLALTKVKSVYVVRAEKGQFSKIYLSTSFENAAYTLYYSAYSQVASPALPALPTLPTLEDASISSQEIDEKWSFFTEQEQD